ncbi:MAG TPA: hypothetical protein VKE22_18615 [Haliangiales bacterium]|nr:hypothetical protein [Haliangiales bacterium]
MIRLILCSLVLASAASAREDCVTIPARTRVYARAAKEAEVGRTVADVTAFVESRGAWTRVRVDKIVPWDKYRKRDASVVLHVQNAGGAARCPAGSNISELGLLRDWIMLRWKDGGEAYSVRASELVEAAAGAKDYIEVEGDKLVCFDPHTFAGLALTACASCARLREEAGHSLGFRGAICP